MRFFSEFQKIWFFSSSQPFSRYVTHIYKTITILINDWVDVLLDCVCLGFLELFCLKYCLQSNSVVMKSKKPENTTYPSSKVKKHRSTNNLEIVGIRAAKIQCRARADLHFTISFENQIIFRPMQLYFTVSIWFSHFSCLSSSCFHYFLESVFQREKLSEIHYIHFHIKF